MKEWPHRCNRHIVPPMFIAACTLQQCPVETYGSVAKQEKAILPTCIFAAKPAFVGWVPATLLDKGCLPLPRHAAIT